MAVPYLGLDGVGTVSPERLDFQMLFYPFEEEFDLPAVLVKLGDLGCFKIEVVG